MSRFAATDVGLTADSDLYALILAAHRPTNAVRHNMPRTFVSTGRAAVSGQLEVTSIYLKSGDVLSGIGFLSVAAATSPTHQFFALYDSSRNLLKQTTDDTNTAWAANTPKALNWSGGGTYTVSSSGLYYVAACQVAGTPATLAGPNVSATVGGLSTLGTKLAGTSTTGIADGTAPSTAASITGAAVMPYCWVI